MAGAIHTVAGVVCLVAGARYPVAGACYPVLRLYIYTVVGEIHSVAGVVGGLHCTANFSMTRALLDCPLAGTVAAHALMSGAMHSQVGIINYVAAHTQAMACVPPCCTCCSKNSALHMPVHVYRNKSADEMIVSQTISIPSEKGSSRCHYIAMSAKHCVSYMKQTVVSGSLAHDNLLIQGITQLHMPLA